MTVSVIVPVYNEESRIAETASSLMEGLPCGSEVVFVCNGCTDSSPAILGHVVGSRAKIINLETAGKAAAIRMGERQVKQFPRFFIDSDVLISGRAIVALTEALEGRGLELVSPAALPDLSSASWCARAVQQIWHTLPQGAHGGFHGVLGVSQTGRSRWGELPDVLADDTFMEAHIPPQSKAIVPHIFMVSAPPKTLWSTVRVRERWALGQRELRARGIRIAKVRGQKRALLRLGLTTSQALGASLYVAVRITSGFLAALPGRQGRRWYQDRTSRGVH